MSAVPEVLEHEPVMSTAMTTPMTLLEMSIRRGDDIDKLERLMGMQERWEANDARKQFHAAMVEFKSKKITIRKNKRVVYRNSKGGTTDYTHATLDAVCDQIIEKLAEVGISHKWVPEQTGARVKVTCVLTHRAGHSESTTLESNVDDSGGKNAIQAIGSAVHYLERYTVLAATGLTVKDQDDDGVGAGPRHAEAGEIYRVEPRTVEPTVEGPTARTTPDDKGRTAEEIVQSVRDAKVYQPPVETTAPASPPMHDGMRRIIRAKLANANLTEETLQTKFGKSLLHPSWTVADFNTVVEWIAHPK